VSRVQLGAVLAADIESDILWTAISSKVSWNFPLS
jgi:hypothetical protein